MIGSSLSKRAAFTLAEVLITLGIIGIVAALTIPALINKVQKHQYVVALQKFYTTQMDGWSYLLTEEGAQQLEDTSLFQSMGDSVCSLSDANYEQCKPFFGGLKKYFRFSIETAPSYKTKMLIGYSYYDKTGSTVLAFADGSVIFDGNFYKTASKGDATRQAQIATGGGHMYSHGGDFYIDINGFKKPNTFGRDIFRFNLSGEGKLYPNNGKDWSLFYYGDLSNFWQNQTELACGTAGSTDISSFGEGCSARIMDESWQMNY